MEAGLELTSNLLESLGAKPRNLAALTEALRTQFDVRSTALSRAIIDGGGHDGPSSSDNEVFKLNEDALPQVPTLPLSFCAPPEGGGGGVRVIDSLTSDGACG